MFSLWFVNKQFINARVVQQHIARTGMNQCGNVRIRKSLAHGSKQRRHQHDVTDAVSASNEDARMFGAEHCRS
jgi:hypothetical protein